LVAGSLGYCGNSPINRAARRPGAEEKFFCPGTTFAVIPLIIEMIQYEFIMNVLSRNSTKKARGIEP
ncbi:MAG: hypothetical protein J7M32_06825, partial [Deltaproteobacteria bacterium]|nr:hypothetical protein [Deltaproteobacteria bacterium]